jgi:YD repeat-containing protein
MRSALPRWMKSFEDANLKTLKWEQSGRLSSRLVADGQTTATLTWAKSWGSLATGESADGEWTFKRLGFLRPRVVVREAGSDSDLAVLSISWVGEGAVVFSDGEAFQFKRSGFWHPEWSMSDSRGARLLSLKPDMGRKKKKADVEVGDSDVLSKRISLLAILGWYVIILISDYDYDGGGSIAAVMAASGM